MGEIVPTRDTGALCVIIKCNKGATHDNFTDGKYLGESFCQRHAEIMIQMKELVTV